MSQGKDKGIDVWEVEDELLQTVVFNGKPIVNINSEEITDVSKIALLVNEPEKRRDWYGPGDPNSDPVVFDVKYDYQYLHDSDIAPSVVKAFHELLNYENLEAVDTLVLGQWGSRYTDSTDINDFLELLLEHEARFSKLKALFVGAADEESDINDIPLVKMGAFLNYFTQIENFKARGAPNQPNLGARLYDQVPDHLRTFFEEPLNHPNLKTIVIETADMDLQTIENLSKSNLPKLEHLELWFGAFNSIHTERSEQRMMLTNLKALLKNDFPSLRYLGLRNSCQADSMANILANSPIIEQLYELDLSLGNLTEKGEKKLLESPHIENLVAYRKQNNLKVDFGVGDWDFFSDGYGVFVYE